MKVLFLDIDGVLNSRHYWETLRKQGIEFDNSALDPACIKRIQHVCDTTGALIVISSSWRILFTLDELREKLSGDGLSTPIIGVTPRAIGNKRRGWEINRWLTDNKDRLITHYAIVDDNSDMSPIGSHLVQTSWNTGIQDKHVEKLIKLLT